MSSAGKGVQLRPLTEGEWLTFEQQINDAFGNTTDKADVVVPPSDALERAVGAFTEDGELVGTGINHSMLLTVPGGARVPVGGVAGISVTPTHRRRGIMSALIDWLIADSRSRGEVASVLTASEGSIYWKQGYGPATWAMTGEVDARASLQPASDVHDPIGTISMVRDPALAMETMAEIHERACIARPGAINRPQHLWRETFSGYSHGGAHWRLAVHTGRDGVADGYAWYGMTGEWTTHSTSGQWAQVYELTTVGPVAHRALWEHLLELDLSRGIRVTRIGLADPIKLMLADLRAFRVTGVMDRLWLRPLDIPRLISARRLGIGAPVEIEVDGSRFIVSSDGCQAVASDVASSFRPLPGLSMSSGGLGSVSLGGTAAVDLVAAGRIVEVIPGSAAALDTLLRTSPQPMMTTAF
jgi:predicted acetyltransferase